MQSGIRVDIRCGCHRCRLPPVYLDIGIADAIVLPRPVAVQPQALQTARLVILPQVQRLGLLPDVRERAVQRLAL